MKITREIRTGNKDDALTEYHTNIKIETPFFISLNKEGDRVMMTEDITLGRLSIDSVHRADCYLLLSINNFIEALEKAREVLAEGMKHD